jgi:hypothetical protein
MYECSGDDVYRQHHSQGVSAAGIVAHRRALSCTVLHSVATGSSAAAPNQSSGRQYGSEGRTPIRPEWWAHLVGAHRLHRIDIDTPTILPKEIEDLREAVTTLLKAAVFGGN